MSNKLDMRKRHRQYHILQYGHLAKFPFYLLYQRINELVMHSIMRAYIYIYKLTNSISKFIWLGQHMRKVTRGIFDSIYAEKLATGDSFL